MTSKICGVAYVIYKFGFILVNTIFMILGLVILILGILLLKESNSNKDQFGEILNDEFNGTLMPIEAVSIIIGFWILIIATLGISGAVCEIRAILVAYATLVTIIIIAETAMCIFINIASDPELDVQMKMKSMMTNYHESGKDQKSKAFTVLFVMMQCCGIKNYTAEFANISFKNLEQRELYNISEHSTIPIACCKNQDFKFQEGLTLNADFGENKDCLNDPTPSRAYTRGCYGVLKETLRSIKKVFVSFFIVLLLLEIGLVLASLFLCYSYRVNIERQSQSSMSQDVSE